MTATRRPSAAAKTPPAKKPAPRKNAKKPAPRKGAASRPKAAGPLGHRAEVIGLCLFVAGLLCGLGVYADLTGPAGRIVRDGAGAAFGWGRLVLPVALAAAGVSLFRVRRRQEHLVTALGPPGERQPRAHERAVAAGVERAPFRVAVGLVLLAVATCGLLHLSRGTPRFGQWDRLRDAGGVVGAAVGRPLQSVLAVWGTSVVLVTLLAVALLILTSTTLAEAARGARAGSRVAGRLVTRTARWLTSVGSPASPAEGLRTPARPDPPGPPPEPPPGEPAPPSVPIEVHVPVAPPAGAPAADTAQLAIDLGPAAEAGTWRLPTLNLLKKGTAHEVDRKMLEARGRVLESALGAHGVETRLVGMTVGPSITRYELELGAGVKVARVTSLQKDIAYAMAAPDIRLLAPIPGRSAIGVEVPNTQRQLVAIHDILASEEAHRAAHPLEVALGRDIAGRPVMANLADMPHILIAGATGAGKSSCINSIITSILARATPDQVRLILVDPKRVELGQYNGLPHLLTQVVVNPKKAANALSWAVHEMERRYDLLAEVGVRDVTGYNAAFDRGDLRHDGLDPDRPEYARLPFILVVVDELNDLMMVAARDVEESICRIAQMARAVGIHLVIATQRPSVDVITGVIKANVPSRLAFAVSSLADSRVILDQPGAERLIGKGDMLLLTASSNVPRRIQGSWVSEEEVRKVVAHWRRQCAAPQYVEGVEGDDVGPGFGGALGSDADDDDLLEAAMDLIVRSNLGSTSMLQRKLKVGFARAGRIMDLLEQRGVVGPSEGSKARAVLMTIEELERHQSGDGDRAL